MLAATSTLSRRPGHGETNGSERVGPPSSAWVSKPPTPSPPPPLPDARLRIYALRLAPLIPENSRLAPSVMKEINLLSSPRLSRGSSTLVARIGTLDIPPPSSPSLSLSRLFSLTNARRYERELKTSDNFGKRGKKTFLRFYVCELKRGSKSFVRNCR